MNPLLEGIGIVNPAALEAGRIREAAGVPTRGFLNRESQASDIAFHFYFHSFTSLYNACRRLFPGLMRTWIMSGI